jgi:uncharacterized protein
MSQTAKAHEPSMEEILASIRRIIADDDSGKAAPRPPEPAPKAEPPVMTAPRPAPPPAQHVQPPPPPKQDEIEAVLAQPDPPKLKSVKPAPAPPPEVLDLSDATTSSFRTVDGASEVIFGERTAEPTELPRPTASPTSAPAAIERDLISTATRAAVDNAFNSLANTVLGNNARTLEDLVKEMLRPMLKSWLDDNLPGLVERLVRAEIERVSRGR